MLFGADSLKVMGELTDWYEYFRLNNKKGNNSDFIVRKQ